MSPRRCFRTALPVQFYINLVDNDSLNHSDDSDQGMGYAVFGKVVSGMDIVDGIAEVQTGSKGGMSDVPNSPVFINSVEVSDCPSSA